MAAMAAVEPLAATAAKEGKGELAAEEVAGPVERSNSWDPWC